jgi:putrescine transport system ATP-binding protein
MQVATPVEIYEQPNSRWVAEFIGEVNLFEGRLGADRATVEGTPAGRLRVAQNAEAEPGAAVGVAVRPEKMRIGRAPPEAAENCIEGQVADIGYLGELSIYKVRIADGMTVKASVANTSRLPERTIGWDERVWVSFAPDAAIVLTR